MERVLVVDDDDHIRAVVRFALSDGGYEVHEAADGQEALLRAAETDPDLVVLDVLMPELDGLEVCRQLRTEGPMPILMLSSKSDAVDRIVGLELGADDYMVKPFSPRELVARVKGILRRSSRPAAPRAERERLRVGPLELDIPMHRCTFRGDPVAPHRDRVRAAARAGQHGGTGLHP